MKIKDKEKPIGIKERIFALIGLDMILPTNFIYREIFNDSPWTCCNDWIGEALKYEDVYNSYWWMWVFIIIAYLVFTYKTEGFDDELKEDISGPWENKS